MKKKSIISLVAILAIASISFAFTNSEHENPICEEDIICYDGDCFSDGNDHEYVWMCGAGGCDPWPISDD